MESRTPPQNLDAEQSVLGSILLDNDVYAQIEGTLQAEHFYKESHRKIWRACERLFRRNEPMDLVTLTEELRQTGELETVGSVPYLIGLADSVPTAAYAESYARIVAEKAVLRDLISASGSIMQTAYDQAMPLEQILDKAESGIFELSSNKRTHAFEGMPSLVADSFAQINELFTNPDPITGLRTGFKELDNMTAGLQPSSLNVLAARPSMGKTALALTIGQAVALREGTTVGIFSLEMSAVQLVMRMLCSEARVDMSRVRNGQLSDRDFQRLADTAGRMTEAKIFIDDAAEMTVMELRSRSRRLMAEHNLGLIVIDYLQLMQGSSRSGGGENRQQEISNISRGLKALARELDVPVLVLSQLSRAVESRPNKRPMLSDLRECVTGDTLVNLADGSRTPIRDLVGQTPEVLAMTSTGRIVPAVSELVWEVGVKPVFEIHTRTGRTLRATGEHRVYQLGGWTTVAELKLGDRLALAHSLPEPAGAALWDEDRLALLGQLVGDGSYLKGQPLRYTTASEENSAQVRRAAEGLGSTVNQHEGRGNWHQLVISGNGNRWQAAGVGSWLKDLGIFGQRSSQKRLPSVVFTLNNKSVATLLRHLWATDGSIFVRAGKSSSRIYFATCSEGLARDVAALLLRLEIVGWVKHIPQKTGQPLWNVEVSSQNAQLRFLDTVGAFGPRVRAAAALRGVLENQKGNPNLDILPREVFAQVRATMAQSGVSQREMAAARGTSYGGSSHFRFAPSRAVAASYAAVLGDAALATLATNDLYWDEVLSVTPAGYEQVYDLTVPGPASWLADGLVSHNSGAIEQDADLVMFIYRDEYYDPHSEKQGIAEIILGKQRNGPVGTVELQFHNAHVRFNDLAKQQ